VINAGKINHTYGKVAEELRMPPNTIKGVSREDLCILYTYRRRKNSTAVSVNIVIANA
jgi:hypothetical protein